MTNSDAPVPLVNHLEELRKRLLISLGFLFLFSVVAYHYVDPILSWLARPVGEFVFTSPTEALFIRFKIAGGVGVIAGFPILLYQMWRFIDVALEKKERSLVLFAVPASSALFFVGMGLAVFGVAPIAMKFFLKFSSPELRPFISIESYMSFLFWMIIGFGVLFQMPLVIVALCAAGVVQASALSAHRKHMIVAIVIAAAFLTPGPDFFSQMLLAIPAYFLFELSVLIAHRVQKS
jgi:sec-independent protein translocase protein TatC